MSACRNGLCVVVAMMLFGTAASAGAAEVEPKPGPKDYPRPVNLYRKSQPAIVTSSTPSGVGGPEWAGQRSGGFAAMSVAAGAIGRTIGVGDVSPTGAATYTIPLQVPPGIRGVEPKLALTYNSQGGNGVLGPGWSMSGLSTITRCQKTWAQDGAPGAITLAATDGFCLEGKRLRVTSGLPTYGQTDSTYQTEIADFSLVTAKDATCSGPCWFEVKRKDGLIYEYGNSNDGGVSNTARVIVPGTTTPYAWALNKIRDRQGNTMIVKYAVATGSFTPEEINYTSTGGVAFYPNSVKFITGPRTAEDNLTEYLAGAQIKQPFQLTSIVVLQGLTKVRQYDLTYATSPTTLRARLTEIQECGFNASQTKICLSPTVITYQNGQAGVASPTTSAGTGAVGSVLTADVDGDGRTDLVYSVISGSNARWWVQFGTSTGFGSAVDTTLDTPSNRNVLLDSFLGDDRNALLGSQIGATTWYTARWNGSTFVKTDTTVPVATAPSLFYNNPCSSADVDGDGKPDLICLHTDNKPYLRLNTSTTTTVSFGGETLVNVGGFNVFGLMGNNQLVNSNVRSMDFNGDGRQDLAALVQTIVGGLPSFYWRLLQTQGAGGALSIDTQTAYLANDFLPLQFNNDACTDIASGIKLHIIGCNGLPATSFTFNGTPVLATDWDADGRADLLTNVSGALKLFLSQGDGLSAELPTGMSVGSGSYQVMDSNGDGLDDLLFKSSSTNAVTYSLHNGAGTLPDLATQIKDGYGVEFNPSYVALTTQTHYLKYTQAVFPEYDYQGPMHVVSQYTASSGTGSLYTYGLYYYGARMHRQGRGFEGFYIKRGNDGRNGSYIWDFYSQTFPQTGRLNEHGVYQADWYTRALRAWTQPVVKVLDATANNQRYFPYNNVEYFAQYEVGGTQNGQLVLQRDTEYVIPDDYGNFSSVTEKTYDKDAASPWYNQMHKKVLGRHFAYGAPASDWCINTPDQTTLQSILPDGTSQTRTVSATVEYMQCRVTQEIQEPNSSPDKVTVDYAYDSAGCGNPTAISVVGTENGTAMAARTTSIDYGSACIAPESITNALGQTTQKTWDYRFGVPLSETDPNGLTTSWDYDPFGRRQIEHRPDGTLMSWDYYDCTAVGGCVTPVNKLLVIQQLWPVGGSAAVDRWTYFDQLDRPTITTTLVPRGPYSRVDWQYDALGNLYRQSAPSWWSSTGRPSRTICSTGRSA